MAAQIKISSRVEHSLSRCSLRAFLWATDGGDRASPKRGDAEGEPGDNLEKHLQTRQMNVPELDKLLSVLTMHLTFFSPQYFHKVGKLKVKVRILNSILQE